MGAQAAVRGAQHPCPPGATALIVTLKKAYKKKTRMNIFRFRFMLFNLKIYGKIVTIIYNKLRLLNDF